VSVKKVPCPVTGDMKIGIHGYNAEPLRGDNVEMVVLNHRLGLKDLWVRGRTASDTVDGTTPWKWVPRGWTNRFDFYPSNGLTGNVYQDSPTKTFDLRLRPIR
jgi:hypothetical protein